MSKRNSAIELLKIIAMFMIVLSHCLPYDAAALVDLNKATADVSTFFLICFRYLGHISNAIFIVCSAFFLSNNTKLPNWRKVLILFLDATFISWITLIIQACINPGIDLYSILEGLLPLFFSQYWFVGAFIVYMVVSPLLNRWFQKLSAKKLFYILLSGSIVILVVFILVYWFTGASAPSRDINALLIIGSIFNCAWNGVGFSIISGWEYLFKTYRPNMLTNKKLNIIVLISSFILIYLSVFILNILGLNFQAFSNKMLMLDYYFNPFILIFAMALFNLVNMKTFHNKAINYISSVSLILYVAHENPLVHNYVLVPIYQNIIKAYGNNNMVGWSILIAIVVFTSALVLSIVYKESIERFTKFILNKIGSKKELPVQSK